MQGWPVIVQAGSSGPGRQLAAETAEVVFTAQATIEAAVRFYADLKRRVREAGRDPEHLKILPATMVIVGDSVAEAQAMRDELDGLVHYDSGIASLSNSLGYDVSGFDPDGPLPPIPETNNSKSAREHVLAMARGDTVTIRQLAQKVGSYSGLAFVGTPQTIGDQMEHWLAAEAADGFTIMFPFVPSGLDRFVDRVVPELQRRSLFRRDYEGRTLREHLGLPRPTNRFFPDNAPKQASRSD